MKKSIKTLFILIGLSLFTFIGINTVKAEASASNFKVVCEPGEIEKGQKSKCYLIAQVQNDATSKAGIHGLLTKVTTSHLTITDFKAGDGSSRFVAEKQVHGSKYTDKTPASSYTCNTNGTGLCYGFFTAGAATPGAFVNTGKTGIAGIDANNTGYTSFGYFEVTLDDDATTQNCGKICVYSDAVASGTGYVDSAVHLSTNAECAEIKPKASVEGPITGSFASITILVAGALIAIGAIAIAKKNNKIYRV